MHSGGLGEYLTTSEPAPGSQPGLVGTFFLFNKPNGTLERINTDFQSLFGSENVTSTAAVISSTFHSADLTSLLAMFPSDEHVGQGRGLQVSRLLTRDSLTGDLELLTEVLLAVGSNFHGSMVSLVFQYLLLSPITPGHTPHEAHSRTSIPYRMASRV